MGKNWLRFVALMLGGASMGLVFAISPTLSAISGHFGGGKEGDLIAQMLLVIPSLGFMLGGWTSGWLMERAGLRRLAVISIVTYGAMGSSGLVFDQAWLLLAGRLLIGFASACLITACIALIAEVYHADDRAKLIGYEVAAGGIAAISGIFLSGMAAAHFGWRAPFSFYLIFGGVGLAAISLSFPAQLVTPRLRATSQTGSLKAVWPVLAMAVPLSTLSVMGPAQLPFLLTEDGIAEPGMQSAVIGMASLFTIIASSGYGFIQLHLGRSNTFKGALVVAVVGLVTIGLSHSALVIGLGSALIGLAAGIFSPYVRDMTVLYAPPALRPRAIGQLSTSTSFGNFIGPFVVVPLKALLGLHGVFLVSGMALSAATIVILAVRALGRAEQTKTLG